MYKLESIAIVNSVEANATTQLGPAELQKPQSDPRLIHQALHLPRKAREQHHAVPPGPESMSRCARHGRTGQEARGLHEANEMNHGDTFGTAWGKEVMAFLMIGWCMLVSSPNMGR